MPAQSEKQQHWMAMAKAVKHGHKLKGLHKGTMAQLRKTAAGMRDEQLTDFARAAKKE